MGRGNRVRAAVALGTGAVVVVIGLAVAGALGPVAAGADVASTSGSASSGQSASAPTSCNFCVLDPSASGALTVSGGSELVVHGNLVVNSTSSTGAVVSNGSTVLATGQVGYVGGWSTSGGSTTSPAPVQTGAVRSCAAGVPTPVPSGPDRGSLVVGNGATATASPGTYSSLGASGGGTLNLEPGLYAITSSFSNANSGTVEGTGVELYFENGANLSISGGSTTNLSSGSPSAPLIFFDPSDAGTITFDNNAAFTLVGGIYATAASLSGQALTINATCIAVDKAQLTNGAAVTQLPAAGLGAIVGIGALCLVLLTLLLVNRRRSRDRRPAALPAEPSRPLDRAGSP